MTWENVATLLRVIEFARDHGPDLKALHDQALSTLKGLDVSTLYHAGQPLEEE